ncbi:hypothetical protein BC834DRAFT_528056 [Gloeopeniophorella convolvens]|nr:hypothetical protein BC834DRAFT_528056 [Gloeopeniophorella convolvens]
MVAFCYVDVKNEFCEGDPGLHVAQDKYARIRNVSPCPGLLIAVAGPYICFLGFVLAPVPVVRHLTDYICLGGELVRQRVDYVARVFYVVAEALQGLEEEYRSVEASDDFDWACLFPRPVYRSLEPVEEELVRCLKYVDRLDFTKTTTEQSSELS